MDTWSGLGSVLAVQVVILGIVLVKYSSDILDVFVRDRGHLEYGEDGSTNNTKLNQSAGKRELKYGMAL